MAASRPCCEFLITPEDPAGAFRGPAAAFAWAFAWASAWAFAHFFGDDRIRMTSRFLSGVCFGTLAACLIHVVISRAFPETAGEKTQAAGKEAP